jgi:hypothetical protein
MTCGYCLGYRESCWCETDCGTADSYIGPCPQSDAGRAVIANLYPERTP